MRRGMDGICGYKGDMSDTREKLINMFSKILAGTVTREEGTFLINALVKNDLDGTKKDIMSLLQNPPPNIHAKTVLHTIILSRNKGLSDVVVAGLTHKSEDVAVFSAQELARLKSAEAKAMLLTQLGSDAYHVRKACGMALAENFKDGLDMLRDHVLSGTDASCRATSALSMLKSGRPGVLALLGILNSGGTDGASAAAGALCLAGDVIMKEDLPKIFDALMSSGDRNDDQVIIDILKIIAALNGKARGFESYVMAFTDYASETVRVEVQNTLRQIK